MSTTRPNIDKLAATRGIYVDDFYRLCKFHKLATGKYQNFTNLAESLNSSPSFRLDFFRLACVIRRKEEGGMSTSDLVGIVALALGGPEIPRSHSFIVPLDLLQVFEAGLASEDERIERQLDQFDVPEPGSQTDPERVRPTAAPSLNDSGLPPVELQNDPSEVQHSHSTKAPTVTGPQETEALERIEWMGITIERRLEAIEAYLSGIAPHPGASASRSDRYSDIHSGVPLPPVASSDGRRRDEAVDSPSSTIDSAQTQDAPVEPGLNSIFGQSLRDAPSPRTDLHDARDSTTARIPSAASRVGRVPPLLIYLLSAVTLLFGLLLYLATTPASHSHAGLMAPQTTYQDPPTDPTLPESGAPDTTASHAIVDQPVINPGAIKSTRPEVMRPPLSPAQGGESRDASTAPGPDGSHPVSPDISLPIVPPAVLPATTITGQQETKVRTEVIQTISGWAQAARRNDVAGEANFYAPMLTRYFLRRSVSREYVERDKQSFRQKGNLVRSFDVSNLRFTFASNAAVMVLLSKSWSVVGPSNNGEKIHTTRSRLWLAKTSQGWKIVGEQDLTS